MRAQPPKPDERLEAFHLWADDRPRVNWLRAAVWGGLGLMCLAFWAAVVWLTVRAVVAWWGLG